MCFDGGALHRHCHNEGRSPRQNALLSAGQPRTAKNGYTYTIGYIHLCEVHIESITYVL